MKNSFPIYQFLADSAISGIESYRNKYMEIVSDIFSETVGSTKIRSTVSGNSFDEIEDKIRFSLVFNDLTLVDIATKSAISIVALQSEWFEKKLGSHANITMPISFMSEVGIDPKNPKLFPIFVFPDGAEGESIIQSLEPLIRSGRLLLQPNRAVMFPSRKEKNSWATKDVAQFSPLENWHIPKEEISPPTPIVSHAEFIREREFFNVAIPYLSGVPFQEFSKILLEEEDLISSLRVALKSAASAAPTESRISEMVRDTVDPKIDAVNRKFKSIIELHSIKIAGAAIGTVALAYTAASNSGIATAIATIAGSGGIGILAKEYSGYKEKVREVQNDPFFFLWRCKNQKNKKI